jgi:hypothetical protein
VTAYYRVWCLSWDDTEEQGSDIVPYDILGEYPRNVRGVVHVSRTVFNAADAAEAYAEHAHDDRDGWDSSWPLVFRVRCPDGTTCDFEVDREYVPEFSAAALEPEEDSAEPEAEVQATVEAQEPEQ